MHHSHSNGFFTIMMSGDWLSAILWLCICFLSLASWPLGIVSIIHCRRMVTQQAPLATKLLGLAVAWLFVLGVLAVAHNMGDALRDLPCRPPGAEWAAIITINVVRASQSALLALGGSVHYMLFVIVSVIIIHRRGRKLQSEQRREAGGL